MTHRRQARLTKAQRRVLRLVARAEDDFLEQRSHICLPAYQLDARTEAARYAATVGGFPVTVSP